MEEKVFFPLEVSVLEESCCLTKERLGQHLAIRSSWKRDEHVFDNLDLSQIQSLTVFGEWREFFVPYKMRSLRVLDLEDTSNVTHDHLEQIIEQLPRLRFLSLRGCSEISRLPDSLAGLRQLQTIDIRDTSIVTLPKSVVKLEKLQYICAGTTVPLMDMEPAPAPAPRRWLRTSSFLPRLARPESFGTNGIQVPRGIGQLKALHTLGVINVNGVDGEAILKELKNLTKLRKLQVSGINRKNSKELCAAISGHSHLESLSVQVKEFAGVIKFPGNLMKLSLDMPELQHQYMQDLGKLEKLHTLNLRMTADAEGEVKFERSREDAGSSLAHSFGQLKVLKIASSFSLHVSFAEGLMGKLELLKVNCKYGSSLELSGLAHLTCLKQVCVKGPCDDILKQQLDEHPNEPVLKLEE
ncbi:hypothetical protein ACP70R_008200 [Stipagrostis hirtigluma subsp. patula]